jgi:HPt (histidine-containing phosphotransfer) domain-containing protein
MSNPEEPHAGPSEVFDYEEAVARVSGHNDLFQEMVAYFLRDWPGLVEQIRIALERSDATTVARVAHRLKGTVVYLGARLALQAAGRVERLAVSGDLAGVAASMQDLEREMARLEEALAPYRPPHG